MHVHTLAVVMPAYNEAQGLPSFLAEVLDAVSPLADTVHIVVVNDRSTDNTSDVLAEIARTMPELHVINSAFNRGHGPTALAAYRAGLEFDPDVVLHVDGDGQFVGPDFPRVIAALGDASGAVTAQGVQVVHGVRRGRSDPWFRKVLTGIVSMGVAVVARGRVPDVNTPLRVYRADALRRLLQVCPPDAAVPHVHFSLAEGRLGLRKRYVSVRSIPRRGEETVGTMWGGGDRKPRLPSRKLLAFSLRAAGEVWRYSIRPAGRRAGFEAAASGLPQPTDLHEAASRNRPAADAPDSGRSAG